VLNRYFVELQNRWSASLAMSTDGSFRSRPRQFFEFDPDGCQAITFLDQALTRFGI
jgi:hypothetical protein